MQEVQEVRKDFIEIAGGEIPITLTKINTNSDKGYMIDIDNVVWVSTENKTHAIVLYELMKDHITKYMHYEMKK